MAKVVACFMTNPGPMATRRLTRGDGLPRLERYSGGQDAPTPKAIDFEPGALLGSVSGRTGLRKFLESQGIPWCDIGQGRSRHVCRARARRRRDRHLATFWPA
ncbi:hypothetical protein F2981_31045 (plasmid) [Sinorhizobium meliloti]|nr:hypothetical protein [Sinorhizobium meliloti]